MVPPGLLDAASVVQSVERLADELPIEQVAKRWIVASDPDEAVAAVKIQLTGDEIKYLEEPYVPRPVRGYS